MSNKINIKPLSVNQAWQCRRFKSKAYINYEVSLMALLPKITLPPPPYEVYFKFGFSNSASDWDNPCKPLQDILQKKDKFNDKLIYRAVVEKVKVKKGCEFIEFDIKSY